jgi:hypothetical protein
MSKFHIGDIVRNPWMADDNPYRNFIYMGVEGDFVKELSTDGKRLMTAKYYKKDVFDESVEFKVVGHSNFIKDLAEELHKY